jgi:TorA maturation chaperone TorD
MSGRASEWRTRLFVGPTVGEARTYASVWLQDFSGHGPLDIRSIRSEVRQDHSVVVVTHRDMEPPVGDRVEASAA